MKLGWTERWLLNNPLRPLVQRVFEARQLKALGGDARAARALEIGCGSGSGIDLLFDYFKVNTVDAFDLDVAMIQSATKKYRRRPDRLKLWVGNTRNIPVPDNMYDAVFDFGTLHHVRDWRSGLSEVHRVLKPGGRFFIEEIPRQLITHPLWRRVLDHPQEDRFDQDDLILALKESGFAVKRSRGFANLFIWCVADKE